MRLTKSHLSHSYYFINCLSELAPYLEPSSLHITQVLQTHFFAGEMPPLAVILHQCQIFLLAATKTALSDVFLGSGVFSQTGLLAGLLCLHWSGPKLLWL